MQTHTTNEDRSSWSKRVQESMRSAPLHIILGTLGKTTKRAQISDAQDAQDKNDQDDQESPMLCSGAERMLSWSLLDQFIWRFSFLLVKLTKSRWILLYARCDSDAGAPRLASTCVFFWSSNLCCPLYSLHGFLQGAVWFPSRAALVHDFCDRSARGRCDAMRCGKVY